MTGKLYPWSKACTLKAGMGFLQLYETATLNELRHCLQALGEPPLLLGRGSNLVGSDSATPIAVLRLAKGADFGTILALSENCFRIGCALSLAELLSTLAARGYGGLAGLSGIPGSLGGALAMNAGANGQEISVAVEQVDGWDLQHDRPWQWRKEEGGWAYRQSPIPVGVIALQAILRFQKVAPSSEASLIVAERQRRKKITPVGASAGSVFRNPAPEQSAGRLLEQAGCKELSAGVFNVSVQHANWIVNCSRTPGKAEDCRRLVNEMQQKVREKFAVELRCEWRWADEIL